MKAFALTALCALAVAAPAAYAETDPYDPIEYTVSGTGATRQIAYDAVRKDLYEACDMNGGYVHAVAVRYMAGWGAAKGQHYVEADVTCKTDAPH